MNSVAKLMFTTAYDDVLSKIETMTRDNIDRDALKNIKHIKVKNQIINKKYGNVDISNQIITENASDLEIKYSLGDFGSYICNSKQYYQLLPQEMYQLRFNQIDTFNLAVYIARMIVINQKTRKKISTLLS